LYVFESSARNAANSSAQRGALLGDHVGDRKALDELNEELILPEPGPDGLAMSEQSDRALALETLERALRARRPASGRRVCPGQFVLGAQRHRE
jgi:hypothetical protein